VHHAACGALKNISYGRDAENKIAIKNCDAVPALVRLLRKTGDQDLTDTITGPSLARTQTHVHARAHTRAHTLSSTVAYSPEKSDGTFFFVKC